MYRMSPKGWLKYWDFMLIDFSGMQISLVLSYFMRMGLENPYENPRYLKLAIIMTFVYLVVVFLTSSYTNIVNRGYYKEFVATVKHVTFLILSSVLFVFLIKESEEYSRVIFITMWGIEIIICYTSRILWKLHLQKKSKLNEGRRSILLITTKDIAKSFADNVLDNSTGDMYICGIAIMDDKQPGSAVSDIPVVADSDSVVDYIRNNWVDEVFINMSMDMQDRVLSEELFRSCMEMGVTIHTKLAGVINNQNAQIVEKFAGYMVLTNGIRFVTTRQLFIKRSMDIVGGITGCLITGLLFIILGPIIYIKSPGPIFFSQIRVGKNGRRFKIYKFRSMYMDAEKRKKELMEQNRVKDGLMFKVDDDPRIIKGIGHFIRKTSLDEFPQFLNVLKGDMSLVGTRPPTEDEWKRYNLHHRRRLIIKPGLTGMWQVSGRSDITDFEEVVKMDMKYIMEWSLGLDLKILLKTVFVVLWGKGSM